MKIEKLQKDEIDENLVYSVGEMGDKINEIIDAVNEIKRQWGFK